MVKSIEMDETECLTASENLEQLHKEISLHVEDDIPAGAPDNIEELKLSLFENEI
jgi:hypothetical protein